MYAKEITFLPQFYDNTELITTWILSEDNVWYTISSFSPPENTTFFEALHDFALTQLDVTLQCEENVASL